MDLAGLIHPSSKERLKRSVVQAHIKSTKHADGKQRLERKRDIAEALRRHFHRLSECTA